MKTPGRHHPAGHDLPRGHRGREASTRSHHDADSRAKVEYRTSSTPAHTDELDLHHSTNNAPTRTPRRMPRQFSEMVDNHEARPAARKNGPLFNLYETTPAGLRIADNHLCTHHWYRPTNSATGPKSALRTTAPAPTMGAYQPNRHPTNQEFARANAVPRIRPVR